MGRRDDQGATSRDSALPWLLEKDQPAVRYYALMDLMDFPQDDSEVVKARSEIPRKGWALKILAKQTTRGNWESAKSLYRPKYTATNWMALILSDLGMTKDDPRIGKIANLFLSEWSGWTRGRRTSSRTRSA